MRTSLITDQSGHHAEPAPPVRVMLARIVVLVLGVRLGLLATGLVSGWVHGHRRHPLDTWVAWDAFAYLRIADRGYPEHGEGALDLVFFPLFPYLVRAATYVLRDPVVAALVISAGASVAAGWFLYLLIRLDAGHAQAQRGVVLLFAFPTAYFLAAPYTEAIFLALVLASVYAARTGRWEWAAAAGAGATATRITGLVLLPALAVQALRDRPGLPEMGRRLVLCGVAGTGFLVYLAVNFMVHADPLAFLRFQETNWNNQLTWPWQSLIDAAAAIQRGPLSTDLAIIHWGRLSAAAVSIGLLTVGWRRLRPSDRVYGWVGLIGLLSSTWLISLPRYLLILYPLFIVLAWLSARRAVFAGLVACGAGLQMWLFSRYAMGWWTF